SGFTWQDDYTQHVIGQELSTIHKIHNRHPDIFASEGSDTGSYFYNDPIGYYMMQKPQERAPPLAHASTSHQQHAENLHGRTFNQPQPDKFSPESEIGLDQKTLMAALHTYITQNLSAQSNDKSSPTRTKGSHIYSDRFYSSQVNPFDGNFAKGKAEDFEMKKLFQPRPASGTLIKDVLKDLEKHQVNVENLSSTELNEIADTIANAIQTVGIQEETEEGARKTEEDRTEAQMKKGDAQGRAEVQAGLMENSINIPDLLPEESTKTETKKFEDSDSSSSEEINAGMENVKSETFSRELTTAKNSESDSKDPSETRYWIKNALMQDGNSYEESQKNMGQGLQLEVKSSEEKEYGYIVTTVWNLFSTLMKIQENSSILLQLPFVQCGRYVV
uniref:Uncharacterized protein n=1 Tax=Strix occidentalis caurina TaxID=311401 RepID=A0A8D0FNR9_STROC